MESHKAVESLQQGDADHGTWVAKELLACTNTKLQFFFHGCAQFNALAPLGFTRLSCVGTHPCKAMKFGLESYFGFPKCVFHAALPG